MYPSGRLDTRDRDILSAVVSQQNGPSWPHTGGDPAQIDTRGRGRQDSANLAFHHQVEDRGIRFRQLDQDRLVDVAVALAGPKHDVQKARFRRLDSARTEFPGRAGATGNDVLDGPAPGTVVANRVAMMQLGPGGNDAEIPEIRS